MIVPKNILVAILLISFSITGLSQETKHVVLISIDGLRPDFYRDHSWPTPTLQRLVKEGISADGVRGVFPSVTYPSHTTIITGAMPARHGIYYNSPFEPQGSTGKWYWETSGITVPTLWDAAKESGLITASVYWPVSVGANIDYNIPEIWSLDKSRERTSPQRELSTPKGLYEEMEREATGILNAEKLNSDYASADENGSRMVAHLIKKYKPNLLTFHIFSVDHAQHADGRDGEHVRQALAGADHAVNNILEALAQAGIKENTTVIVTGDHGFVDIHSALAPNVWLANLGLYKKEANRVEWKAQFHTSGAAAFLMLKDTADKTTLEKIRQMLQSLPAQQRKLFRIVERKELDEIGGDPNVALALAPIEGIAMSSTLSGEALRPSSGGTHGFFPDFEHIQTGFIAAGGKVEKGKVIAQMGLEDIAPLVARLLNLKFNAPDGILYPGMLRR